MSENVLSESPPAQAKWYTVSVHSGSEAKVCDEIRRQVEKKEFSSYIYEILVPAEDVIEVKRGQKVNTEKKFFPGYILINMVLTEETWHLVRNVPKVASFLGSKGGKPLPMKQSEIDRIKGKVQESIERPRTSISFEVGERVRVCDGPFVSFVGLVEEVDYEKARLKVSVSIFGRATPVDLEFTQVEKV